MNKTKDIITTEKQKEHNWKTEIMKNFLGAEWGELLKENSTMEAEIIKVCSNDGVDYYEFDFSEPEVGISHIHNYF